METQKNFPIGKMENDHPEELMKNLEKLCSNVRDSLRNAEERFHIAVEDMGDWEYWIGQNNQYIFVSPACERITGHKPGEFIADQRLLLKITHTDDREQLERHISEEQNGGEIKPFEFRIINKLGEQRFIAHKCRRVYDSAGNSLGIRATNRDLTDVKRIETEKQALENRVRNYTSTVEMIGRLTMQSMNSFNNMVQKILGSVELLCMESNKAPVANAEKKSNGKNADFLLPVTQIPSENNDTQTGVESKSCKEPYVEVSTEHQGKILLIDDEEFILDMASDMLKIVNYDVITACKGADGIELFRKHKDEIACVVLDFNLPDYDGKTIYQELKSIKEDIPILISSGSNEHEIHLRFDDLETVPFLHKPYHFSTLVCEVNKLVPMHDCVLA